MPYSIDVVSILSEYNYMNTLEIKQIMHSIGKLRPHSAPCQFGPKGSPL